jgi:hypothetical protein
MHTSRSLQVCPIHLQALLKRLLAFQILLHRDLQIGGSLVKDQEPMLSILLEDKTLHSMVLPHGPQAISQAQMPFIYEIPQMDPRHSMVLVPLEAQWYRYFRPQPGPFACGCILLALFFKGLMSFSQSAHQHNGILTFI